MKIQAASTLAILLVLVPAVQAQRGRSDGDRPAQSRPEPPRPPIVNLPSSPILPMTNPVAPMTNPVMPFVRYGGTPTVVIPSATSEPSNRRDDRRRSDRDVPVVVLGGYYLTQDPVFYYPQPSPVSTPGQLPSVYREFEPPPSVPGTAPSSYASIPYARTETEYVPEPHIIITPEIPPLTVVPPAIGTLKAEVLARYGDPWGSIRAGGQETLYFSGGLVVVFVDGRVSQIK